MHFGSAGVDSFPLDWLHGRAVTCSRGTYPGGTTRGESGGGPLRGGAAPGSRSLIGPTILASQA